MTPQQASDGTGADEFDVVVVGAGPVGENVAQYVIEYGESDRGETGLTVAMVEAELLGGECSYWACIPSKVLLRPLAVAATAADLGDATSRPGIDRDALLARRDDWVSHYDDRGQLDWAESAGITVVRGTGRIAGERRVTVDDGNGQRELRARHAVVLATGSAPTVPEPFVTAHPWGSRDATGVLEVPDSIVIIGGGVVACEAATWLTGLGTAVTMLVRGDRLLESTESFAGEAVTEALRGSGVDVRFATSATDCRREDARDTGIGRIHGGAVSVETPDGVITAAELLVATGRRPRLDDVGLESVGLDGKAVLRGQRPAWLHAIGDASGEAPLTHWGKYRARVLGEQIAATARGRTPPAGRELAPVPQVVFTDPQVAAVGRTESGARAAGIDVVTTRVPFNGAAGSSLLRDHVPGEAQLVVDRSSGVVVGATFAGPEAGELLHAATIAITGQLPVAVLRHAVPAFPTASELWLRLLESLPRELRH